MHSCGPAEKVANHTKIPDYKLEAITGCLLPDILAYYESEESQREFARWQQEQKAKQDGNRAVKTKKGRYRV